MSIGLLWQRLRETGNLMVGLPDEDLGAQIHAIVQARPGLEVEDLRTHLAERLVTYKRPRSFEFVDEPLRDEAGKVRRAQLREDRVARMKTQAL